MWQLNNHAFDPTKTDTSASISTKVGAVPTGAQIWLVAKSGKLVDHLVTVRELDAVAAAAKRELDVVAAKHKVQPPPLCHSFALAKTAAPC